MKIRKELEKAIKVIAPSGNETSIRIRPDDMVQMGAITKAIKLFEDTEVKIIDNDIDKMIVELERIGETLDEVNKYLDMAFGSGFSKSAFEGEYSYLMYDDFFTGLAENLDSLEGEVQKYIKEKRKKVPQDHKQKDTL